MLLPDPTPDIRIDYDQNNHEYTAVKVSDSTILYRQRQNSVNGINQFGFIDGSLQFVNFLDPAGISVLANAVVQIRSLFEFSMSSLKFTWTFFSAPYTVTAININGVNILSASFDVLNDQPIAVPLNDPPSTIPENSRIDIVTSVPDIGLFFTLQFNQ